MARIRNVFFVLCGIWIPTLAFANLNAPIREDYVHPKHTNIYRKDPRWKAVRSQKGTSCRRAITGICTLPPSDPTVSIHRNKIREQEYEKKRKLRPWL